MATWSAINRNNQKKHRKLIGLTLGFKYKGREAIIQCGRYYFFKVKILTISKIKLVKTTSDYRVFSRQVKILSQKMKFIEIVHNSY